MVIKKSICNSRGYFTEIPRFNEFQSGKGYFTPNEEAASTFANGESGMYHTYIAMHNPLEIDAKGADWDEIKLPNGKTTTTDEIVYEATISDKYDGIIIRNVSNENYGRVKQPIDEYIPFKPNQIKSANENNGEFSTDSNDIRFRKGYGKVSDEEVSRENDPKEKMSGESSRSRAEKKRFAERERRRMRSRAEDIVNKLHISDDVEIVEDASEFGDERATAKGFFDTRTGKITVVLGNHASAMDVAKTVLHEAVSHYGLRKLFGKNFDSFLDNVFDNAEVDVRERIVDMSKKYNWGFREATKEYLGKLAEDTDFENTNAGFWQKIKNLE